MGPPRHLGLLPELQAEKVKWPVPFAEGIDELLGFRGRKVVALASGDPFWFGAGGVLARHLKPQEWIAFPGRSTFSLAASRLGWPLEMTRCFGLHAAPLSRLRPHLAQGHRSIVLLRDGMAVSALAEYLEAEGFEDSMLAVMESLGGPREQVRWLPLSEAKERVFNHPLCVAMEVAGSGPTIPLASGIDDAWFETDGQITKRPIRALTLSALAPRPFEHLWDIGGGSGSIGIEWLLSHPTLTATTIEPRTDRAERIRQNADRLGVDRLEIVIGAAPECLNGLTKPVAVFIGGGLSRDLLDWLESNLPAGTRVVANAVTLESEALLSEAHIRLGGDLLRIELSQAGQIGPRRGWKAAYPIVQWSHVL